MKNKSLLMLAVVLALFSCSEDHEVQYSVSPELEVYVITFISEAQERGVTIPKNNLIARVSDFEAQAIANSTIKDDQKYLFVNKTIYDHSTSTNSTLLEYNIFNVLGELFIRNKVVISTYDREAFFNELIK